MIGRRNADSNHSRIIVSRILHRGSDRLLLSFPFDKSLINSIKGIEGRRYSKTYKSWHLPYHINSLQSLSALNIDFSIKQGDEKEALFLNFISPTNPIPSSSKNSEKSNKKIHFLIESFAKADRPILSEYITYLSAEGYSWNSINLFSRYASAYMNNGLDNYTSLTDSVIEPDVYKAILENYLEFRRSR